MGSHGGQPWGNCAKGRAAWGYRGKRPSGLQRWECGGGPHHENVKTEMQGSSQAASDKKTLEDSFLLPPTPSALTRRPGGRDRGGKRLHHFLDNTAPVRSSCRTCCSVNTTHLR